MTSSSSSIQAETRSEIIIRPARLFEGSRIGYIAAKTYFDTPLSLFLSPKKSEYYSHYERGFKQRAQARLFQPNNLSFVAVQKSNPSLAIGYAQFQRLGNDEGYHALLKRRDTYCLRLLAFLWSWWTKLVLLIVGGDKSRSPEALALFLGYGELEEKIHWEKRKNRWEAQSVVVLEEFQGQGIGKMLMRKVIELAEQEGVFVGLHATEPGRYMYQSVGFELLSRYQVSIAGEEGGGVMLYTPTRLRKKHG